MNIRIKNSDCILRVGVYPTSQRCALWLVDAHSHQMVCHITLDQPQIGMAEDEIIIRCGSEHQDVLDALVSNKLVVKNGKVFSKGVLSGQHCYLGSELYQRYLSDLHTHARCLNHATSA